jgi:hypothetical protein
VASGGRTSRRRTNEQIVTLLATLPVGSSSGWFTYTFNPTLGSFSRSSAGRADANRR